MVLYKQARKITTQKVNVRSNEILCEEVVQTRIGPTYLRDSIDYMIDLLVRADVTLLTYALLHDTRFKSRAAICDTYTIHWQFNATQMLSLMWILLTCRLSYPSSS